MITKGQPDLLYGGTFFSLLIIYLLNLALLVVMLVLASPQVTWAGFGRELLQNTMEFTVTLTLGVNRVVRGVFPALP